jgi:hypothetical protein
MSWRLQVVGRTQGVPPVLRPRVFYTQIWDNEVYIKTGERKKKGARINGFPGRLGWVRTQRTSTLIGRKSGIGHVRMEESTGYPIYEERERERKGAKITIPHMFMTAYNSYLF